MAFRTLLVAGAAAVGLALPASANAQALAQATTDLHLRAGPGTNYAVIGTMPRGAQVQVHQCPGSWCQVSYGGATGWASHRYLGGAVAMQQPRIYAAPQPSVTFGLEVGPRRYAAPYRYDPRWHSVRPGWYDDFYWSGQRWYYDDDWHYRPRSGFSITFGG